MFVCHHVFAGCAVHSPRASEQCRANRPAPQAILENVIFVHQEDSNWPLAEGKARACLGLQTKRGGSRPGRFCAARFGAARVTAACKTALPAPPHKSG
jgi:hypothetical protein